MNNLVVRTLALLLLFAADAGAQTARARIADMPIRSEANLASAIIATMKEGASVDVVDLQGDWYRVLVPNEQGKPRVGYVLAHLIEIINTDGSPQSNLRAARPIAQSPPIPPTAAQLSQSRGREAEREQALKAYVDALQAEITLLRNDRPTSEQPPREGLQPLAPSPQTQAGLAPNPRARSTASTPVPRVKSASAKLFLGAGLEGTGIVTAQPGTASITESGAGLGLVLGYGFTPMWAVYGNLSGANISALDGSTFGLGHVDVGVRAHFLTGPHVVVPFVQGGLSSRGEAQTFSNRTGLHDVTASGMGVGFGGGLNVHVRPALAISGGVTWSVGNFTNYTVDKQTVPGTSFSATSARVHVGIVWFPQTHAVKG